MEYMPTSDSNTERILRDVENSNKRVRAEKEAQLVRTREDAHGSGKQPFDLQNLSTLCDLHDGEFSNPPVNLSADDIFQLEYGYYVKHPEVTTLSQYAVILKQSAANNAN